MPKLLFGAVALLFLASCGPTAAPTDSPTPVQGTLAPGVAVAEGVLGPKSLPGPRGQAVPPSTPTLTPAPERTLPVFPEPPLADLTIGEQHQTAGLGSYCWRGPNETNDGGMRAACADMIGLPTAHEPLQVDSPFTADFRIRFEESPSELRLEIHPVETDDQLDTRDRDIRRWWRPSGTSVEHLALPPAVEASVELSLEPGLYVFNVFAKWPGMGDASYGFLVEVR